MVSKFDSSIKSKPAHKPIERWLKKIFRWKSKEMPVDPNVDRRDFYRLVTDSRNPLDLCLTMEDERVFCTNIDDLSASGFGCRIKGLARIHSKQPITALFVLPMEEPRIIKSEVFLVSVLKGNIDEGDLFRFRFTEEIKDIERDLIHRYIVLKQFEALERERQENSGEYDDDYLEDLTGN
jgi:c-di-GMP-binding flagellar brake protein YcgR